MDCPHCRLPCLGPVVLPCGHISCQRCLHDALQQLDPGAGCKRCRHCLDLPRDQVLTDSQLVQQVGTVPVMEHMIYQQLENDMDIHCLNCPNSHAAYVCVDYHEYYCDVSSASNCRMRATKGHDLHLLPQALLITPSAACTSPSPTSPSVQSTSSLDSIHNLDDTQSHGMSGSESSNVFEVFPKTADDTRTPRITAVVCPPEDTLVMVDYFNRKVKMMGVAPSHIGVGTLAVVAVDLHTDSSGHRVVFHRLEQRWRLAAP
ncbi:uncharacterized protein LOC143298216 [Babylonia areolata]|uniref:uncharacterized protein LOC143298216 n=1 Tax=Babylonia areolata TaxID=304850 RepID=UPI003FCF8433